MHSNRIGNASARRDCPHATVFADITQLAYNRQAFFERSKDYG